MVKAGADTAFVLGNGPSLRGVDLHALNDFATFGLNAAYRYWREIDWRPTYYVCLDLVVGLSHADAIGDLIREGRIKKFLLRSNLVSALGEIGCSDRVVNFDALMGADALFQGPVVTTGSGAALWAASLGYRQIVIHGVDGRYTEIVPGAERREGIELEIVASGENPNYFFDGYQRPGDRYNIPNPRPDLHVGAWREVGARLKTNDVRVYNANPKSGVRCFAFVDWRAVLGEGASPVPPDEPLPQDKHVTLGTAQAPLKARMRNFLGDNIVKIATIALVCGVIGAFAIAGRAEAAAGLLLALVFGLALALVYVRYIAVRHLNSLQIEVSGLKERMAEIERRAGEKR